MRQPRQEIPHSVINRLTDYLAQVQSLREQGVEWVSSLELATALGLTGSTVRQDLSHLDVAGISKRGYEVVMLEKELVAILGADTQWNLAVIGAGNMGRALAIHEEFGRRGFHICAIFDADSRMVGKKVGRLVVERMDRIPQLVQDLKIDMGVLAVPAAAAQQVADILIASGIRGLINLALTHVTAPERVPVVDARLVASLLELAYAIKAREGSPGPAAPPPPAASPLDEAHELRPSGNA